MSSPILTRVRTGPDGKGAAPPILSFESAKAWASWLAANHASSDGIWLRIARKDAGIASVTYAEALEVP